MNIVDLCECGNELKLSLGFKMCGNCHHSQKDCICKYGLNDQSDSPSWRNACKCGREKYKNTEGDWICPSCIVNENDCQCQVLEAESMRKKETPLPKCIETYPASPMSPCICLGAHELHMDEFNRSWTRETIPPIVQEQPQPHGTGAPVGERLIELIRERTKLGIEKYGEPLTTHNGRDSMLDALQESIDLNQYQMQALMESEAEIKRLSEEQIKPLADFLMQQSDKIGHPSDEGACAMAIRVIGELTGDN